MQSGNGTQLERLRMVLSGAISLVAIISATVLLFTNHAVPIEYWTVTAVAVAGVAGAQVVQSVMRKD